MQTIDVGFDAIIKELSDYRIGFTKLTHDVKMLERKINKELYNNKKNSQKKVLKKPSGFAIPTTISKELCSFMNKNEGEKAARTEVTQYIIKYIKEKELQNKENKQEIILDKDLGSLLNCGSETVTYFSIQKYMNQHFISAIENNESTP
jgi:chromatin remodeling complex protein RSC6